MQKLGSIIENPLSNIKSLLSLKQSIQVPWRNSQQCDQHHVSFHLLSKSLCTTTRAWGAWRKTRAQVTTIVLKSLHPKSKTKSRHRNRNATVADLNPSPKSAELESHILLLWVVSHNNLNIRSRLDRKVSFMTIFIPIDWLCRPSSVTFRRSSGIVVTLMWRRRLFPYKYIEAPVHWSKSRLADRTLVPRHICDPQILFIPARMILTTKDSETTSFILQSKDNALRLLYSGTNPENRFDCTPMHLLNCHRHDGPWVCARVLFVFFRYRLLNDHGAPPLFPFNIFVPYVLVEGDTERIQAGRRSSSSTPKHDRGVEGCGRCRMASEFLIKSFSVTVILLVTGTGTIVVLSASFGM